MTRSFLTTPQTLPDPATARRRYRAGLPALGASLLALAAVTAVAQEPDEDDPVRECRNLRLFVQQSEALTLDEEPEIVALLSENAAEPCYRRLIALRDTDAGPRDTTARRAQADASAEDEDASDEADVAAETGAETERQTRTVREEVEFEETVTVEGTVDVAVPTPDIEIGASDTQVDVSTEPPRVTVDAARPEIVVRHQAPSIIIDMPRPTVTIEQPAPEIIVTMPDPSVDVASAAPKVEVRQAQPEIRVAMGDPRIDLDLRAVPGEGDGQVDTRVSRDAAPVQNREGMEIVSRADEGGAANVYFAQSEPSVNVTGGDRSADVTVTQAEPTVRFEEPETPPQPEFRFEGEPRVEYRRMGEPTVTLRTSSGNGGSSEDARREEASGNRRAAALTGQGADAGSGADGAATEYTVADLTGMAVFSGQDERIGKISRIVRGRRGIYAVIEHGGFFGVGSDEVVYPVTELTVGEDGVVASRLTEEVLERLGDQDIPDESNLEETTRIQISSR